MFCPLAKTKLQYYLVNHTRNCNKEKDLLLTEREEQLTKESVETGYFWNREVTWKSPSTLRSPLFQIQCKSNHNTNQSSSTDSATMLINPASQNGWMRSRSGRIKASKFWDPSKITGNFRCFTNIWWNIRIQLLNPVRMIPDSLCFNLNSTEFRAFTWKFRKRDLRISKPWITPFLELI